MPPAMPPRMAIDNVLTVIFIGLAILTSMAPVGLWASAKDAPRIAPPTVPTRTLTFFAGCRDVILNDLQEGHCGDMVGQAQWWRYHRSNVRPKFFYLALITVSSGVIHLS